MKNYQHKLNYKYRLTKIDFFCLLFTAIFFDSIQAFLYIFFSAIGNTAYAFKFIPFVGWILSSFVYFLTFLGWVFSLFITIFAFLTFWFWLKIKKVGIFDKGIRKILVWMITPLIEALLGFVPGLTLMIILTYYIVKADDELDKKKLFTRAQQEVFGKKYLNREKLKQIMG